MTPYQFLGIVACCVSLFVGVLMFLSWQGVPLPVAFLGVYVLAITSMLGMQRRARESCEGLERRTDPYPEPRIRSARGQAEETTETVHVTSAAQETFRA